MLLEKIQKIIPPRWASLLSLSAFFMLTVTHRTPLALLVMLGAIATAYIYIYIYITEENGLGSIYDWSRYATYLPLAVLIAGGMVTKLFGGMGISFITTNILRILAIPIIAQVLSHFHRLLVNWWQGLSCEVATKKWVFSAKTSFAILFGIYLLGISALLRANVYYSDDNWRFSSGSRGWDDWSRFFTERSSIYFFGGKFAVDVSPYSQILAVAILALVGILLLGLLYRRKVFTIWEVVALMPLGLNPFFMTNLSFKFDAPFMAFSLLAAVFPLVFRFSGARWYVLACFLGSLLVLTSYQASFGIFPMLVILLLLRMWQEKGWHKELGGFLWQSLLGYGAGALYFYLVVMIVDPRKDYLDVSIPALSEIPEFLLKNYTAYFTKVWDGFTPLWLITTLLILGSFLVCFISKKRNLLGFVFSLVSLVLMLLLSFGFYPILVEPQLNNRAMYGLVVVIVLCGLVIVERGRRSVLRLPILVLSYSFFVYALVYGNALATIDDYRNFRLQLVYEDLSHLPQVKNKETVDVYFPGKIPAPPSLKKQFLAYPMLAISHNEYWDRRKLSHLPTVQTIDEIPDKLLPTLTHLPMLVDTYYHTIYGDDMMIYIRLKEKGKVVE